MEKIVLEKIQINKNKLTYFYSVTDKISKYFMPTREYSIKYEMNIEGVPKNILAIPFVCNVLPISWLFDAEIVVEELDADFLNSVNPIKNSYQNMYPNLKFMGELKCEKIIQNNYKPLKVAMMFSGGVDATATLVKHISEEPLLINLQGSDIKLKYKTVLDNVQIKLQKMAQQYSLPITFVETSFREVLNEKELDMFISIVNDNYWHALQHGIAILSHAAPIVYLKKIKTLYIASSYTKGDNAKCASDPSIDNMLKLASTVIYHDNFDLTRGEKIQLINNYCENNHLSLNIRVCFNERKEDNCCKCEKCYRTIFEIISRNGNPKNFGFDLPKHFLRKAKFHFKYKIIFSPAVVVLWKKIQHQFRNNPNLYLDSQYTWFLNFNFEKSNNFIKKLYASVCIFAKKMLNK